MVSFRREDEAHHYESIMALKTTASKKPEKIEFGFLIKEFLNTISIQTRIIKLNLVLIFLKLVH